MDKIPPYHSALSVLASGAPNTNLLSSALGLGGLSSAAQAAAAQAGINALSSSQWRYVTARFSAFLSNIALTPNQLDDGKRKQRGVISCLNWAYYGHGSETENAFLIGSWGKNTQVRPPRDVDLYFLLPPEVYYRFENHQHGKQSALLQEVKAKLLVSYPRSNIKGDGPVVLADFVDTFSVEVVPAFALQEPNAYWVCNTRDGGSYQRTRPRDELVAVDDADRRFANNARPLIKMLKVWQKKCNVPIKSFHLELLAIQFLEQSPWRENSVFYYDWICRDFFSWLCRRANTYLLAPGIDEVLLLGDRWLTMAQTAARRASLACEYEYLNSMIDAGNTWQMIFGDDIPRAL